MSTAQFAGMTREQALAFMPNAQPQPARKRLAELVAGRDVIDIGCGKGEEVGDLYDPNSYLGVDCSPELIRIARARWPLHRFEVLAAQDLPRLAEREPPIRFPCATMKAVLEHLPPNEAVRVYEAARRACDVLYVAWHTEPGSTEKLTSYHGELGPMVQNRHDRALFHGVVEREVCGAHVIWTVSR